MTDFTETRSEHHNLVYFAHFFQEIIDTGSLNHIHIVPMILDFNRHYIVGLLYRLIDNVSREL